MRHEDDAIVYWVWLYFALGACSERYKRLLRECDDISEIYDSRDTSELAALLTPAEFRAANRVALSDARELIERCEAKGIRALCADDPEYPELLRITRIPPAVIFVSGDVSALRGNCVAGVGARRATKYGRDSVRRTFTPLAQNGVTLVSGMAYGIDAEVHLTALENAAKTIAVLGTPIDVTYPESHGKLRERIEQNGCVVSEYAPGTPIHKGMFPQRNRIISGLSRAVVVFEAAKKSGTMITANWALDDGRDVFAVPGSIFTPTCEGTNYLIKQGAFPLTEAQDLFDALHMNVSAQTEIKLPETLTGAKKKIYDALCGGEAMLDELCAKTGLPAHELLASLCEMEMDSIVSSLAGGRYAIK